MDILISIVQVLQLNSTLFIYLVVFAFFVLFLSKKLMTPYYQLFLERQKQTQGLMQKALDIQKENDLQQKKYEDKLIRFNHQFRQTLQEKKDEIVQNQQTLIEEARSQADVLITNSKKKLIEDFAKAEQELQKSAKTLGLELSNRLVQ